jgi:hypothetical protein
VKRRGAAGLQRHARSSGGGGGGGGKINTMGDAPMEDAAAAAAAAPPVPLRSQLNAGMLTLMGLPAPAEDDDARVTAAQARAHSFPFVSWAPRHPPSGAQCVR